MKTKETKEEEIRRITKYLTHNSNLHPFMMLNGITEEI